MALCFVSHPHVVDHNIERSIRTPPWSSPIWVQTEPLQLDVLSLRFIQRQSGIGINLLSHVTTLVGLKKCRIIRLSFPTDLSLLFRKSGQSWIVFCCYSIRLQVLKSWHSSIAKMDPCLVNSASAMGESRAASRRHPDHG